jgi:hypothetical protein
VCHVCRKKKKGGNDNKKRITSNDNINDNTQQVQGKMMYKNCTYSQWTYHHPIAALKLRQKTICGQSNKLKILETFFKPHPLPV